MLVCMYVCFWLLNQKGILVTLLLNSAQSCRLAGATLVVPVINFWWPSFPSKLAKQVFRQQLKRDQVKLTVAHHFPALMYWWFTQKWFPYCSIMERHPILFNKRDLETIQQMPQEPNPHEVTLNFSSDI